MMVAADLEKSRQESAATRPVPARS
jgi:hypothetical protein